MLAIIERQQNVPEWTTESAKGAGYIYVGYSKARGLHVFEDRTGKREYFAKRATAPAGWHLQRGAYYYEFCSSL